jgi:hypothetical protein
MSDDRDYWRRQDEMREERRREYIRDDWRREDDRRREWEREDREYEERQREENQRRAFEEMRRGDTASALNHMVGPDAAIDYLNALAASRTDDIGTARSGDARPTWPPHVFVTSIDELIGNVASAPTDVAFSAERIDDDGDALIEAMREPSPLFKAFPAAWSGFGRSAEPLGHFWICANVLAEIDSVATTLQTCATIAAAVRTLAALR